MIFEAQTKNKHQEMPEVPAQRPIQFTEYAASDQG
jgi:hypothetical protein